MGDKNCIAFDRLRQWVAVILRLIDKHLRINVVREKERFGQAGHDSIQHILIVRGRQRCPAYRRHTGSG